MGGYVARHGSATGVLDDLEVNVLALRGPQGPRLAWIGSATAGRLLAALPHARPLSPGGRREESHSENLYEAANSPLTLPETLSFLDACAELAAAS